jgi:glycerate dehydrogenase
MHRIVYLDADSLIAQVRAPGFAHEWIEFGATTQDQVFERLQGASICIANKVPVRADVIARLPQLKMIAVAATGMNNVDVDAARAQGIVVDNVRDYSVNAVPEHTFALILALRRNLLAYRADVEAGQWQLSPRFCLFDHPIRDLAGSRLGIIGYGVLGQAVARLGKAFGMDVVVATHNGKVIPGAVALPELLSSSDIVSLHLPLTDATRGMIGAGELRSMRPGALLINTARGGLVDESALAQALQEGLIGAGFDVLAKEPPDDDNPLLNLRLPNFILTPHCAWASKEAMQKLADILIDNIEKFALSAPGSR